MTTLIPIEDHILVEPIEIEQTTKSGIVLTDTNKEKPSRGKVIAIGAGKILDNGQRAPMDVKAGDIVHFTKYSPDELEVGNHTDKQTYLVIKHSAILVVEG